MNLRSEDCLLCEEAWPFRRSCKRKEELPEQFWTSSQDGFGATAIQAREMNDLVARGWALLEDPREDGYFNTHHQCAYLTCLGKKILESYKKDLPTRPDLLRGESKSMRDPKPQESCKPRKYKEVATGWDPDYY